MTERERWARLEQLFDQALDTPTGQRDELLASAAIEDLELAAQVRRMLQAHDRTGVLDRRIAPIPSDTGDEPGIIRIAAAVPIAARTATSTSRTSRGCSNPSARSSA